MAVVKIMGGLPVVEDLVAVLDGTVQSCDCMAGEENGQGN